MATYKDILRIKENKYDVEVTFDIASTRLEKEKITNVIYEILSCYGLDTVVKRKNQSTYTIEGLATVDYKKSVCEDIYEAYVDWYTNRQVTA